MPVYVGLRECRVDMYIALCMAGMGFEISGLMVGSVIFGFLTVPARATCAPRVTDASATRPADASATQGPFAAVDFRNSTAFYEQAVCWCPI